MLDNLFPRGRAFDHADTEGRTRRANRRRAIVFGVVFALVALVGLVYDFSRPAIYEATARLSFGGDPSTGDVAKPWSLRDEAQFITSRKLLADVWERLKGEPVLPPQGALVDPAASLQNLLTAIPLDKTNIVLLTARGGDPAFLKVFLDKLVAAYKASLSVRYRSASATTLVEARDEAANLDASLLAKRKEADAFRARYNIVSLERDENQVLSEVKGMGAALNAANERLVAAEARMAALQEAQAAGRAVTRSKDNPTLASLEQQAGSIRAELKELGRKFTQEYMNIDPRIVSMRARLADIEEQIGEQRKSSQQGALQEATEELAGARSAAARLRQQLGSQQQSVQSFTSRFNEYRTMQGEVARIEQLRQKAVERLAGLEAEATTRAPKVDVVEAATTPTSPASPPYLRDAGIALAIAVLAGLLTMGIVELFNRPPPQPATVVLPQTWMPVSMDLQQPPTALAPPLQHPRLDATAPTRNLPAPVSVPRELRDDELRALLDNADPALRVAISLLLSGVTRAEVVGLAHADLDRATGSLRVADAGARTIALAPGVVASIPDAAPEATLVTSPQGAPLGESELDKRLLYVAHDAGIERADEVDADALHHTYVAFLVRQGVRFSELATVVGEVPAERLSAYGQLAPAGPRSALASAERVMPVLRD